MGKFKALQDVTIIVKDFDAGMKVLAYLNNEFPSYEWTFDTESEIYGCDEVSGYCEKTTYYDANGTGSPGGVFLEEGLDETYLQEEIKEKTGIEVKVNCELRE